MGRDYVTFIKGIDSDNTAKVAKSLSYIGEHDYSDVNPSMIDEVILGLKPKSMKDITTSLYIMSLYAAHIENDDMLYMVRSANRKSLWRMAKPNAPKKFLSHSDFYNIYDSVLKNEEHNGLYQASLFASVYHGIYSDDLSVLKNLRSSDIKRNNATLRKDDGTAYDIGIPYELAEDLVKLGGINEWWRNNRYGSYRIITTGTSDDACFKIENRNGTDEYTYRYGYYRIIRKISKEYIGRTITPLQIYISGIMNRLSYRFDEIGITLADAFSDNNKDRVVNKTIKSELESSGYNIEVRNFREIVKGHIDSFE